MDASRADLIGDWARCSPYLEAALIHTGGTHTLGDVFEGVVRGDFQFWPGARCAVVTEFYHYPRLKAVNFWLLGGELKELLAMRPRIEAWARAHGCTRVLGGGVRSGWERVLARAGYRRGWSIYTKELAP